MINALNLDHRMILGGEQPNLTNALAGGVQLGGQLADMQHQGAYRNALADFGADALRGDQTAINALAGFDPQAMQQLQIGSLGMDQTRQSMESTRQQMNRLNAQERRAAEEYARGLAADEAQTLRAETEDMLKQAAYLYMTGQQDALPDFLETNGFARDAIAWDDIPREIYRQREFTDILGDVFPAQPEFSLVTGDQAAAMGLDPAGAYNLGRDGKVSAVGGGGTNVTVNNGGAPDLGKLSTDYGYVLDPITGQPVIDPATGLPQAAPVPGSPAARAMQAAEDKVEVRDQQQATSAAVVLQDIDKAISQVSWRSAGLGGAVTGWLPGSPSVNLNATLDTIRANIGFDRLQQMREASPTGGALGGIAVQELQMLQAVLGSLTTSQSPEQLEQNLTRLRQIYEPIAEKAAAYPNAAAFGFGGGSAAGAQPSQQPNGYAPTPQPQIPPSPTAATRMRFNLETGDFE